MVAFLNIVEVSGRISVAHYYIIILMKYWNIMCFCFYKKSAQEIIEQNNYVKMKMFN